MVSEFNPDEPIDPAGDAANMNAALLRLHQAHQAAIQRLMAQTEADIQAEWQTAFRKLQPAYRHLLTKYGLDLDALKTRLDDQTARLPLTWLTNNKTAAEALQKAIQQSVDAFAADAADAVASAQASAAPAGAASALALLNQALTPVQNAAMALQLLGHHPSEQALEQFIARASNGAPLETLFNGFGAEAAAGARQALLTGLGLGENPAAMASDIAQALQISRDRAMVIARTETLNSYRSAAFATYQANSDVVKGWVWSSAQNANTCAACIFMDGSFHTLDEGMDTHVSCRCQAIPATSSWGDILGPLGVDQSEIDDIAETSMAEPGVYRAGDYGAAWFDHQPATFQRDVLGPAKFAAYSRGDITLGDLVGVHHDSVWGDSIYEKSLKELGLNARDYLTVFGSLPGRETSGDVERQLAEFQAQQAQALAAKAAKAALADAAKAAAEAAARGDTAAFDWEAEHVAGLARAYGVEPPPLFGRGTGATGTWEQWYREQIEPLLPASERGLFGAPAEAASAASDTQTALEVAQARVDALRQAWADAQATNTYAQVPDGTREAFIDLAKAQAAVDAENGGRGAIIQTYDPFDPFNGMDNLNAQVEQLFGRTLTRDELGGLVGAPEGAYVDLYAGSDGIEITLHGPSWDGDLRLGQNLSAEYNASRSLRLTSRGNLVMENDTFFIHDPTLRGQGLGAQIFSDEAQTLSDLGVVRIETFGAGDYASITDVNGYYTWPRFGYTGKLPSAIVQALQQAATEGGVPSSWGTYTTVQQLMRTEAGRVWWKENGVGLGLSFDLRVNSYSMRVLRAYLAEKGVES